MGSFIRLCSLGGPFVVLAACAGEGQGPSTPAATEPDQTTTHDVVVVGAGSAGMYAARSLIGEGYDVLLIEAKDRIGGRVKSATLGDMRVELGAEEHYLATGDNPVWPAITDEYGDSVYVEAFTGSDAYSMDQGTNTCWFESEALRDCGDDDDVRTFGRFANWYWRPDQHQDPETSLADDVLAEYGVDSEHRAYHLYDEGFAGGTFATNLDKLGARSLALQDSQWDLSGGIRAIGDKDLGYSDALETVWWDDVVAQSDLLLSSPVVEIDTSGDDVVVTDAHGDRHLARQVIVTVSIGVLQAEKIDFTPDLPDATVAAYNGIGMDMGMKVALRFGSVWWETEGVEMARLVTEGLAGFCWTPSDYKVDTESHILMCYPMGDNASALNELAEAAGGGAAGDEAIIQAILDDLIGGLGKGAIHARRVFVSDGRHVHVDLREQAKRPPGARGRRSDLLCRRGHPSHAPVHRRRRAPRRRAGCERGPRGQWQPRGSAAAALGWLTHLPGRRRR